MGQRANSGRNASLDQKKQRMAGRANTNSPERAAIRDASGVGAGPSGPIPGAFGRDGVANRRGSGAIKEGGGGGGRGAGSKSENANVGRSTRPAKKR
jgi:hypothetical protein